MDDSSNISNENYLERSFLDLMQMHKRRALLNMDNDKVKFEIMTIDESTMIIDSINRQNDIEQSLNNNFADMIKAHYRFMLLESDKKKPSFHKMEHEEALKELESIRDKNNKLKKKWPPGNIWYYSAAAIFLIAVASYFFMSNISNEKEISNKEQISEKQKTLNVDTSKDSEDNSIYFSQDDEKKESPEKIELSKEIVLPEYYLKQQDVFGFIPPGKDTVFIDKDFVFNVIEKELKNYGFERHGNKLKSTKMHGSQGEKQLNYHVEIIHLEDNRYMIQTLYSDSVHKEEYKLTLDNISNKIREIINDIEK